MLIDAHFSTPDDGYLVGGSTAGEDMRTIILHTTDAASTSPGLPVGYSIGATIQKLAL